MKQGFLQLVIIFGCTLCGYAQTEPAADLIIQNAHVWTVDASRPEAEAVAVLGHRIVAVGSSQQVDAWRGPHTRVVDAGGKRLLPGFNDAHVHFADGGAQLDSVQLNDATSAQEFVRRIRERAAKSAKGEWLLGGDWDETKWSPPELPTKELIDSAGERRAIGPRHVPADAINSQRVRRAGRGPGDPAINQSDEFVLVPSAPEEIGPCGFWTVHAAILSPASTIERAPMTPTPSRWRTSSERCRWESTAPGITRWPAS